MMIATLQGGRFGGLEVLVRSEIIIMGTIGPEGAVSHTYAVMELDATRAIAPFTGSHKIRDEKLEVAL